MEEKKTLSPAPEEEDNLSEEPAPEPSSPLSAITYSGIAGFLFILSLLIFFTGGEGFIDLSVLAFGPFILCLLFVFFWAHDRSDKP